MGQEELTVYPPSGKGAREAAAAALTQAILSRREDTALQVRGVFRGFEILSRGRPPASVLVSEEDQLPELLIRGEGLRTAQLNAENPVGTIQSIEHALRALDKNLADETERLARAEKMLADYQEQLGRLLRAGRSDSPSRRRRRQLLAVRRLKRARCESRHVVSGVGG